jgi:hypothetical protein
MSLLPQEVTLPCILRGEHMRALEDLNGVQCLSPVDQGLGLEEVEIEVFGKPFPGFLERHGRTVPVITLLEQPDEVNMEDPNSGADPHSSLEIR